MTTINVIIRLISGMIEIDWKAFLGKNYKDWFIRIDKIETQYKDTIFYNSDEMTTTYWSLNPIRDEEFSPYCSYKLKMINGEFRDSLSSSSLIENKKIGEIYSDDVRKIGIIGIGDIVIDQSFVRTSSFKIIPSNHSEFVCMLWITAKLVN